MKADEQALTRVNKFPVLLISVSLMLVVVCTGCTSSSPTVVVTHSVQDDPLVVSDQRVVTTSEKQTIGGAETTGVNRTISGTVQNRGDITIRYQEIRLTAQNSTGHSISSSRTVGFNNITPGEKRTFQGSFSFTVKGDADRDQNLIEVSKPFY